MNIARILPFKENFETTSYFCRAKSNIIKVLTNFSIMNLKNLFFFLLSTAVFVACQQESQQAEQSNEEAVHEHSEADGHDHDHEGATAESTDGKHFGATIDEEGAIEYTALAAKMAGQDSVDVKVVGTVESVCQAKGCWMNITAGNEGTEDMFVKFKDYGFFMPKDIAGRRVVMSGKAYREETSVDELRHYAEDEGQSAEEIAAITEPKVELKFMADGVLLLD